MTGFLGKKLLLPPLLLIVFLSGLIFPAKFFSPKISAQSPRPLAIFLMGDSAYLYSLANTGRQHLKDTLQTYLGTRLSCSFTLSTPTSDDFNADGFRIWGNPLDNGTPVDRDLATVKEFIAAKNFVSTAVNSR